MKVGDAEKHGNHNRVEETRGGCCYAYAHAYGKHTIFLKCFLRELTAVVNIVFNDRKVEKYEKASEKNVHKDDCGCGTKAALCDITLLIFYSVPLPSS